MPDSIDARTAILNSIRTALRSSNDVDRIASEYAAIPRAYKRKGTLGQRGTAGALRASAPGI